MRRTYAGLGTKPSGPGELATSPVGEFYAQFDCAAAVPVGRGGIFAPMEYTSQLVGPNWRSTITSCPSFDSARRCVSSLAPLKNVRGADTVNWDLPP
jgi:hypothetical protein